jgi:NMD protein affecting ribosome stability and mRNA decay
VSLATRLKRLEAVVQPSSLCPDCGGPADIELTRIILDDIEGDEEDKPVTNYPRWSELPRCSRCGLPTSSGRWDGKRCYLVRPEQPASKPTAAQGETP